MRWRIPERFRYLIPVAERYGNYGTIQQIHTFIASLSVEDLDVLAGAWDELLAREDFVAFREWLSTMDAVTSAQGGGWQMSMLLALYRSLASIDPRFAA